jgi:DNA-nicking Smr family endonuclease
VKKIQSLADLKQVKKEIDAQAKAQALKEAQRKEAAHKAQVEKHLFSSSVGKVEPLPARKQALRTPIVVEPPAPVPKQRERDEQAVLREALSDAWDSSSLLDTDEALSFRRPGVGMDVVAKLRRGEWSVQAELDLHSLRTDEAREHLGQFIRESHKKGIRCVRVVHGKGLGSPGKEPVLKPKVQSWLIQKNQVIAFVQATPAQGGAGALVVLLQGRSQR